MVHHYLSAPITGISFLITFSANDEFMLPRVIELLFGSFPCSYKVSTQYGS